MTAPLKPALKRAFGKDSWGFVPAVAVTTAPTVAELAAAGGFNLSCSLFGDQGDLTATTGKVTLPRLLCETQTYESNDATNYSAADLVVSFQPQAASGADGKKAWEAMDDLSSGFLWRRQDVDPAGGAPTAGQFVDIVPVDLGVKVPMKTSNDASGVYAFTQGASVTGAPAFNVAVVA
jgi:hypothetical protein